MNNKAAGNDGETSRKAESSKKRNRRSLKVKSEIKKGPPGNVSLKVEKTKDHQQFRSRNKNKRKSKGASKDNRENNRNELENFKNHSSRDDKLQKNDVNEEHADEDRGTQKKQERSAGSSKIQPNLKNKEKRDSWDNRSRNQKSKKKLDVKEKNRGNGKKKEKLGGLIFMCNAKTKPDCFRYQVMGVTLNKKDLVLGVKPRLKLFLYDFDLKLMYGIYQATSSGGMKLEPEAFGGSFPVQVRFSIHKDCIPLPESVFKKAIKDNYDANNKFDIQLTVRQVRKLSELFRPVAFQSAMQPVTTTQDREAFERLRESQTLPERKRFSRINEDGRRYPVIPFQRDHEGIDYQEVVPTEREEAPRDLYLSEKEYRTYGLQRERLNITTPHSTASVLDPYPRNFEREHLLKQPAHTYNDAIPVRGDSLAGPPYRTSREYLMNHTGGSELQLVAPSVSAVPSSSAVSGLDSYSGRNPCYSYSYSIPSRNSYMLLPKREEVSSSSNYIDGRRETYLGVDSDPLHKGEADAMNKLYLKYGVEPLSDYKQAYQVSKPETVPQPVSSRYSFGGPSASYRL